MDNAKNLQEVGKVNQVGLAVKGEIGGAIVCLNG